MTKDIGKPTLAEKQAFWKEQLPLFKEEYWLPEHFELLKFDMEAGNFVVRDDIDPAFEDDADDLYHRINTGWSMWKRAVNQMNKKLEGCVVVPVEPTDSMYVAFEKGRLMSCSVGGFKDFKDGYKELIKAVMEKKKINKLQPIEVVRDKDGFFTHPQYSNTLDQLLGEREYPTEQEWEDFKKSLGIEIFRTWLDGDAPQEVVDRYFKGNIEACADWNPSYPSIDGDWFIVSIHDTEDGAVCLWAKEAARGGNE